MARFASKPLPTRRAYETPEVEAASTPTPASVNALQTGVVVVAALYFGRDVLVPITVAVLLSFLLTPLVSGLRKTRIGRVPSVILAALLSLVVILGIGGLIGTQIAQLATQLPQYIRTVETKVETARDFVSENLASITSQLGLEAGEEGDAEPEAPAADDPATPAVEQPAPQAPPAATQGISPLDVLTNYVSPVLSPFATAGIIFVVAVFTLLQKEDLRDRMIRLFGSSDLHRTTVAMDEAAKRLSRYFLMLLCINVGFGVVIGVGLFLVGVPNPVLWGILGSMLRFVPYVGPIISALLPIALAAAVDPGWSLVVWTIVLFIVVELIFNQVVEPLAYGQSTGLSPFAVIVAAIFWGWLWGPVGLILSAPLTLCLVVLGRYVERLEFLDVLLGDRPALTPAESFYQRMLAGDPDEAQEHAEILLKERSLSSYYDQIALKGLQLAADDLERGVLDREQLQRVRETTESLVAELDAYADEDPSPRTTESNPAPPTLDEQELPAEPPPQSVDPSALKGDWASRAPILCLAGKGPLDEATSTMLAQLLTKHGLGARVAPYSAASRDDIGTLDLEGVAMVCVSYLDIGGSPSHLRYLLRRLRARAPGVPLLVGIWPADDSVLTDSSLQSQVGADHFTTSLRDAVNACVAEAGKKATAEPSRARKPDRTLQPAS